MDGHPAGDGPTGAGETALRGEERKKKRGKWKGQRGKEKWDRESGDWEGNIKKGNGNGSGNAGFESTKAVAAVEIREEGNYRPIRHFRNIEAWKLARKVRVAIYRVVAKLPPEERFDLGSQMRKASVSGTSNIAEGYGRFHFQGNIQFCRISRGSLYESQDHLITCMDNAYISKGEFNEIWTLTESAIRVVDGYIRYLNRQAVNASKPKRIPK